MAPLLELRDVYYAYRAEIPALAGVSFAVAPGERVAILGANGSGKTTLLRLLAGLLFPQRGSYRAFGREITEPFLASNGFGLYFRKEIGIVFQNADAQLFNPTVADEIAFGVLQLNESPAEVRRRTQQALTRFALEPLAGRPPFALSTGEKKKVSLASVLVMDPQVLLLDEPTAGLDPRSSVMLMDLVREAERKGTTVITASNDLHVVTDLATRAVVLGESRNVIADGLATDILADRVLLADANILHRHRHAHDGVWHEHPHQHPDTEHRHEHGEEPSSSQSS